MDYGDVLSDGRREASRAILTRSIISAAKNRDIGSAINTPDAPIIYGEGNELC